MLKSSGFALLVIPMLLVALQSNHALNQPHSDSFEGATALADGKMSRDEIRQEPMVGQKETTDAVCVKLEPTSIYTRPRTDALNAQGAHRTETQSIKVKPEVMASLKKTLGAAPSNCVVIANDKGEILQSFRLKDSTLEKYSSFEDYVAVLSDAPKNKPCKRTSDTCVLCADGKIYCTNAAKYRAKNLGVY